MAIADTITSMYTNVGNAYNVLTLAGANLTSVNKNLVNLTPTWKERLLYFMNNGTDVVWNNWDKVNGSGTSITLNNTEYAPMKLEYGGNTSQDSTTGKNLIDIDNPTSLGNATISVSGNTLTVSSTVTTSLPYAEYVIANINVGDIIRINGIIKGSSGRIALQYYDTSWHQVRVIDYTDGTSVGSITNYTIVSGTTMIRVLIYSSKTIQTGNSQCSYENVIVTKNNDNMTYEPYTNGPSPNPSYPQTIHTVSGDNSINVVGKNLFKNIPSSASNSYLTMTNNGKKIHITGESDSSKYPSIIFYADGSVKTSDWYGATGDLNASKGYFIQNDGTYTLSVKTNNDTKYTITIGRESDVQHILPYNSGNRYATITNQKVNFIGIGFQKNSGEIDIEIELQLEKGDQATTYTPYTSNSYEIDLGNIELNKISTYQDYIRKSTGKNLFDGNVEQGAISQNNNQTYEQCKTSNSTRIRTVNLIPLDTSKSYKISIGSGYSYVIQTFNSEGKLYGSGTWETTPKTITNVPYIAIAFKKTSEANITPSEIKDIYVMLNEGTTALPYEPYGTDWYKYSAIGKVVLNGSEDWQEGSNTGRYNLNIDNTVLGSSTNNPVLSDRFQQRFETTNYSIFLSGSTHTISIMYQDIPWGYGNFKTWLSNNNTIVYYAMATPTYDKITDTTLINQLEAIKSKTGQTNISQTPNDLPFELSVTALEEMN